MELLGYTKWDQLSIGVGDSALWRNPGMRKSSGKTGSINQFLLRMNACFVKSMTNMLVFSQASSHCDIVLNWVAVSPYLCQHSLRETGLHEDLYDLRSINKAVVVGVCFLEDVIISLPIGHRYHPVHCWLEWAKKNAVFVTLDEGEKICLNLECIIFLLQVIFIYKTG